MKEPIKQYKPVEKLELPKVKKEFPKTFKKVSCPSCSEDVNAENINLQNSVAKCGSCHVVFSIEEELASVKTKEKEEMKQEFFRPEGINLFNYKDEMEISLDGYVNQWDAAGFMLFLGALGIGLILYFDKNMSILFPLISMLGMLFFTFRVINYKKNRIFIDINEQSLTVRHRPNNLVKDLTFLAEDIDQIYIKHSSTQGGYFEVQAIINGPQGQYHKKLLVVNTLTKAKYMEQEIEKYLGIEDRKVLEGIA